MAREDRDHADRTAHVGTEARLEEMRLQARARGCWLRLGQGRRWKGAAASQGPKDAGWELGQEGRHAATRELRGSLAEPRTRLDLRPPAFRQYICFKPQCLDPSS